MQANNCLVELKETRSKIEDSGVSIAEWARLNGFSASIVYGVLDGKRKCVRGQSFQIAVALGLRQGNPQTAEGLSQSLKQNKTTSKINSGKKEAGM